MVGEIAGGLAALKGAFDLAKALKDIDDAATINSAVLELQQKILEAQAAQGQLVEENDGLQKKLAEFDRWEIEKDRYALKDFSSDTFAYELLEAKADGEPIHRICPNCYQQREKSILQARGKNAYQQTR
ncbi:MAG: hypothetical protein OEM91_02585 [Hyphomicrobiales bacterium]|nr:hypothetical protein [Hyphomicrobiales bacterium]